MAASAVASLAASLPVWIVASVSASPSASLPASVPASLDVPLLLLPEELPPLEELPLLPLVAPDELLPPPLPLPDELPLPPLLLPEPLLVLPPSATVLVELLEHPLANTVNEAPDRTMSPENVLHFIASS
jgi:hypothetical protein